MTTTTENKPKVKEADRNIFVCDQGHFGSTTCSACGADAKNDFDSCSNCGAIFRPFDPNKVTYNTGGSDFG